MKHYKKHYGGKSMKNKIKKFMSMLMAFTMFLSLNTINAFAASAATDDAPSFERVR